MEKFELATEADWPGVWNALEKRVLAKASEVRPEWRGASILALEGELGVGKTTFVKTIVEALGSRAQVTSPTFSLVQEYESPAGAIFHFDLYRLNDLDELHNLDFEEYIRAGYLLIVEWPQIAEAFLRRLGATFLRIEYLPDGGRSVEVL